MAEEDAESGERIEQQAAQQVRVGEHAGGLLAKAQQLGAQIVFHLGAVEGVVHLQAGDHVFAVEHHVLPLDVVELDGETIGGGGRFALR